MGNKASESFPRQLRMIQARQYRQAFDNNNRIGDSDLTILVGKQPGTCPRIGFAIARKQIQKAVFRNRLKRIFRESFRKNQHRLPARDMVIMVRKAIMLVDAAQLNKRLDKHWNSVIEQCKNS
jgi:ribonuclease P protein component